jgi:TPR repeat protein
VTRPKETPPPAAAQPAVTPPPAVAVPAEPFPGVRIGREDLAYAAFQRGHYKTALTIATQRVEQDDDVKAMALLGELYGSGLGVKQDDSKAAEWYRRAADRGDREAMFALAMLRMAGRAGPVNREEAAKLLAAAARLKHPLASYNLALLYLEGQLFPRDFARAAELFRIAAEAGSAEAQYALAALYKEGRGVKKDVVESTRLLYLAAIADNIDALVEYAIALFNGSGVAKNEEEAARFLERAARRGSPIAQNRLAHIRAAGRGLPADPVEAIKWHLISKEGGASDQKLDAFMRSQNAETIAAATKAAHPSIEALRLAREPRS